MNTWRFNILNRKYVIIRLLKLSLGDNGSMDILIIGNGFDLAHGLETSYKQFLEFVDKEHSKEDSFYKEFYLNNLWLKHFMTRQNDMKDTWIDLETEIYDVIRHLKIYPIRKSQVLSFCMVDTNFSLMHLKFRDPVYGEKLLKEGYIDSIHPHYVMYYFENNNDLIDLLYEQLRLFSKAFEKYLLEVVLSKDIRSFDFAIKNPVSVLSFNYTDTFERLYKQDRPKSAMEQKYIYVHGKINDGEDCKLVLGTDSFENINTENHSLNIPVEYNVFKKHNQRHRYNTIESYQDFYRELIDPQKIIKPTFHIIGHSLDKTDHIILRHILKARKDAIINIYYHTIEAEERMINNITNILDEEDVMSRVRFIHQHDDERSILKRKS